jgi:hypothetical protein
MIDFVFLHGCSSIEGVVFTRACYYNAVYYIGSINLMFPRIDKSELFILLIIKYCMIQSNFS